MLVERDEEHRVHGVGAVGARAALDRLVDLVHERLARAHVGDGGVDDLDPGDVALAQPAERRVEVVVVVRHARLDERVGGQGAELHVLVEVAHRREALGAPVLLEHGRVQHAGERDELELVEVDPPGDARLLEAVEDRGRRGCVEPLVVAAAGLVRDESVRRRGVEERPVAERLRRHRAVPVVVDGEVLRERGEHGQHRRGERPHDLRGLVGGGRRALAEPHVVDPVVAHEARHRRVDVAGRRVERGRHGLDEELGVRGGVDGVEDLGVDVRELLARVGVRAAHDLVGRALVDVGRDDRAVGRGVGVVAEGEPLVASRRRAGRRTSRGSRGGCRTSGSRP